jgi:hypothetical protein
MNLKESTGVQFSLSFLIQVLATVAFAVWGYSQLDARISVIENDSATSVEAITRIEADMELNQDRPISSDHIQNTMLSNLDTKLDWLKEQLILMDERVYALQNRAVMLDMLPGKKTYIVAAGAVAYALGAWLTGNMDMVSMINYLFMGAGAVAIRKAISS